MTSRLPATFSLLSLAGCIRERYLPSSRPRLLRLDEPTMGLTPMLVERVFTTLRELRAAGLHGRAKRSRGVRDRRPWLHPQDGRIVHLGEARTLLPDASLQAA